jgi:eukaryotic-like serine/threonine-protein kinase
MALIDQSRIWDESASPFNGTLVRRFIADWRRGKASPPDPASYLPEDPAGRPAALLAVLRADLALRLEGGEQIRVESYLGRFPELPPDLFVALAYEEYCARSDAGLAPDPDEYDARFPTLAAEIRDLIDIHKFVDSSQDLLFGEVREHDDVPFPRAGETISGFRLVEELGRGRIARVFLAEERHLADRPVALKVSRMGSREPQTLALLQHTHIVPVHSYHVDVVTGFHLLCMPYFGRLTLADVLSAPRTRSAKTGTELLAALDELGTPGPARPRAEGREALQARSFAQAIAWWGARLAEALQYAHDYGVLHHDIKPSNVLITADATPMLLDFNLARASGPDGRRSAEIGGTLAYMAPEHIDAVTGSKDDTARHDSPLDGRADIYSLGALLHEVLGSRPYWRPEAIEGLADGLRSLIAARRAPASLLKRSEGGRRVPAALAAVIRRCLEPDPADRYAQASELAADLQAVADDAPLCFAREPEPSRTFRWASRNRRGIVLALGALALTGAFLSAHTAALRREALARRDLDAGIRSASAGEFTAAAAQFSSAFDRAGTGGNQALRLLAGDADRRRNEALRAGRVRDRAQAFFLKVEPIRFRLTTGLALNATSNELRDAFADFNIFGPNRWTDDPELDRLDPLRRARLVEEINEILFLWVMVSDNPGDQEQARRARAVCDRALLFAEPKGPWLALKARYDGHASASESVHPQPLDESSARACFEWGLLAMLDGRPDWALAWFERAVSLRPDQFWYQFALAYHHALHGDAAQAMAHYDAAVALRPQSSWALLNRAQLAWSRQGAWDRALLDLNQVRMNLDGLESELLALELGRIAQRLGDFPTALEHYETVIAANHAADLTLRARLNRARIELELGPAGRKRARDDYERLVAENPNDSETRLGHALVSLRIGRPNVSDADLTRLLTEHSHSTVTSSVRAEWLAARALARLAMGRTTEAGRDADEAVRLAPSPGRLRIQARLAIATGHVQELVALDADDFERLPGGGRALTADLREAVEKLTTSIDKTSSKPALSNELAARKSQAVLLSALGNHEEALAEANRLVALAPLAADLRLLRAGFHHRAAEPVGALADVESGLALAPGDVRLQVLLARLLIEQGKPAAGLAALDRAFAAGAGGRAHTAKAQALWELRRYPESIAEWTLALRDDSEDSDAFLGRARCFARLGRWEPALADLESAVDWSYDRPSVLARAALVYAACLTERPNRLSRACGLAWRAFLAQVRQ